MYSLHISYPDGSKTVRGPVKCGETIRVEPDRPYPREAQRFPIFADDDPKFFVNIIARGEVPGLSLRSMYGTKRVPGTHTHVRVNKHWTPDTACAPGCPGWFEATTDSYDGPPEGLDDFVEVERCDDCNRFYSDADAALWAFEVVVEHYRGRKALPKYRTLAAGPRQHTHAPHTEDLARLATQAQE